MVSAAGADWNSYTYLPSGRYQRAVFSDAADGPTGGVGSGHVSGQWHAGAAARAPCGLAHGAPRHNDAASKPNRHMLPIPMVPVVDLDSTTVYM